MEYTQQFEPDEAVFQVSMNLADASALDEALRTWLPLVSVLRPLALDTSSAFPGGMRTGYVAKMLVATPLPAGGDRAAALDDALRSLLTVLDAPGLVIRPEEGPEPELYAQLPAERWDGAGPYGVYTVFAAAGYDPLNPSGGIQDYPDTDDDI